jgi:flagellar capping protein FliD
MGSDLRLTGLASGMDWQPIVDKLIELEAIPKQRLEREKEENAAKVSDLGTLKSQLTTLQSAASALQNESLFNSRKVNLTDPSSGLSAMAAVGALTGDFKVEVESLASQTEISSRNRTSAKLSAGIDKTKKLSELPLHTKITTGTFTIAGKTFNISSLDITLQDLLDEINGLDPEADSTTILIDYDADKDKLVFDTGALPDDSQNRTVLGSSTDSSNFLQAFKLLGNNSESIIESTHPLGSINMTVSLASANFASSFTGLASGLGNFFIGEGEGAVRIDYDINNDSLADVIDRVNDSDASVHMYYDPIGGRFVVRNKEDGAIGIVMHESQDWDTISSANKGNGNFLNLIGLAPPGDTAADHDPADNSSYNIGDYVRTTDGSGNLTYWKALQDSPTEDPSVASTQWLEVIVTHDNANNSSYMKGDFVLTVDGSGNRSYWQSTQDSPSEDPSGDSTQWLQVIKGVARTIPSELGQNSSIRINGGDSIFSTSTTFSSSEHGYEGISFDISRVSIGATVGFSVSKDLSTAKGAIDKFVEEFNDAQDYIASLTRVNQEGDDVSSSRFTGNQEINRLASELRRSVFGHSSAHSESVATSDSSNLTISDNDGSNTELINISTQMNLGASDDGYVVKVLNQDSTGNSAYFEWDGANWQEATPSFSVYRLANIGLDFGISSNNLTITDASLLLEELDKNPEKIQALFAEVPVEDAYDTISKTNRSFEGITYTLNDYIDNFLNGDEDLGYKGAYQAFLDSIEGRNDRIDEKIENIDKYLESRERILSEGFMRMEEMQSKMDSQMQTLQNSFNNNKK